MNQDLLSNGRPFQRGGKLENRILLSVACADSLVFYSPSYERDSPHPHFVAHNFSSPSTRRSFTDAFFEKSQYANRLICERLNHIRDILKATIFNRDTPALAVGTQEAVSVKRLGQLRDGISANWTSRLQLCLAEYVIRHFASDTPVSPLRSVSIRTAPRENDLLSEVHNACLEKDRFSKGDGIFTLVHAMRLSRRGEIARTLGMCVVAIQRSKGVQDNDSKFMDLVRISPESFSCARLSGPEGCSRCQPSEIRCHEALPVFVFPFDRIANIHRADLVLSLERVSSYMTRSEKSTSVLRVDTFVDISFHTG
mmetsp:Transcript_2630/g.4052  ORF Transcript_2630/g.4052 Transcript_2630/m.4052 type:complete len:311 (-) Transcript_2630:23-955(-)